MPLNMNTVGSGIPNAVNSTGNTVLLKNTNTVNTNIVSTVYNQDLSRINIQYGNYSDDVYGDGTKDLFTGTLYNGSFYQSNNYSSDSITRLNKYTLISQGDITKLQETLMNLPYSVNGSSTDTDINVFQVGDYMYIHNYSNTNNAKMTHLYRFDGTSFTALNTSQDPYKFFFNVEDTTVTWDPDEHFLYITPINTKKYDGNIVLVDMYHYIISGENKTHPLQGYTGIFRVDDSGFHLLEKRKIYAYTNDDSAYVRYVRWKQVKLLSDSICIEAKVDSSNNLTVNTYEITYEFYNSELTDPDYTRLYTLKKTDSYGKVLANSPVYGRVSYPQYDTFLLCCIDRSKIGTWFQLKFDGSTLSYKKINATYNNSSSFSNNYRSNADIYVVCNSTKPYMYMRDISYQYSSGWDSLKFNAYFIDWDATYISDKALFNYYGYLVEGDTICCDDGIISYTLNGVETTVNKNRLKITNNGYYTIKTHVYDAYTYPSFIILDKNKNIVHMKYSITQDGKMEGYFIRGMTVNGVDVDESIKSVYTTTNDRFEVSIGGNFNEN